MKEALYKLVDLLTFKKGLTRNINGFHLKLPARYVNYFPADYEEENFAFLKDRVKTGDTVLDVGAHIGLFSVISSHLCGDSGKVLSFEPASETFALLQQTIRINDRLKVISPTQAAVGDRSGKITFYVSPIKGDNSNSLVSYKDDRELIPVEVDMVSIDDLVVADTSLKPSFIKIDVEGAELDALRGASQTMRTFRPSMILAIHPDPIREKGDSVEAIFNFIREHRYAPRLHGKVVGLNDIIHITDLYDLHLIPE